MVKNANGAGVSVSRSADGLHWIKPVMAIGVPEDSYDKDWITCDNHAASPHYGNCYVEADIDSKSDKVVMSTSSDGAPPGPPSGHRPDPRSGSAGSPWFSRTAR